MEKTQEGWHEERTEWKKIKKGTGRGAAPPGAYVGIPKSRTCITVFRGCDFHPGNLVDVYVSGQGAGRGVKVGIVGSPTGEFSFRKSRVYCKVLLKEELAKAKPGRYEIVRGRIQGAEAIIFTV
jgi:hypothetical protein